MRYLRLLGVFYRYALESELEYRAEFLSHAVMSIIWLGWAIVGVSVFFLHTTTLGDWSYDQVLLVVALFTLFNGLMESLLRPNIGTVIEQIRDGTFDFVKVKPVNAQFLASLRNIAFWHLADVLFGIALIIYALGQMHIVPTVGQIAVFVLMIFAGAAIVYAIWLTMVSLAFWFIKLDNITELFFAFYEAGRYPITIYRGVVRAVLTFVVPVAFVTTFPASALLGRLDPSTALLGFALALALFLLSSRFWNYALRHYASASS